MSDIFKKSLINSRAKNRGIFVKITTFCKKSSVKNLKKDTHNKLRRQKFRFFYKNTTKIFIKISYFFKTNLESNINKKVGILVKIFKKLKNNEQ